MNANGGTPLPQPTDHELRMTGRAPYYSFSFDLGHNVNSNWPRDVNWLHAAG